MSFFQKALLVIILVEIPLRLDTHLDYQAAEAALGALGGWNVSLTTCCLAALYAAWALQIAIYRDRPTIADLRAALPALGYVAVMAVSVLVAIRPKLAMFELFATLQALLLHLYIIAWVRTRAEVRLIVTTLLFGLALQALIMMGLRGVGHSVQIGALFARIDESGRIGGTIGSPNEAASFLTLAMALALGAALAQWQACWRAAAALAFLLGAAAMVTTLSRGGWLGCGVAISLLCMLAWWRGKLSLAVPATLAAGAVLVLLCFQQTIVDRLTRHDKGSAHSRIPLMMMALEVIEDRPVLGAGANNLTVAMRRVAESSEYRGGFVYVVHNRYLHVMSETGAAGLAAFLIFLAAALRRGWRRWSIDDGFLSPLGLGIFCGIAGEMLHMTVETFSGRSQTQLLWILAGLAAALARMPSSTRRESDHRPAPMDPLDSRLAAAGGRAPAW